MKKTILTLGTLAALVTSSQAAVTIAGTPVFGTSIFDHAVGVYVSSTSAVFDASLFTPEIDAGVSFTEGTQLAGYTILGTGVVTNLSTFGSLASGVTFDLGGNVVTGNEIGILVFASSTTSSVAGDTYSIFTNGWTVGAEGSNNNFATQSGPPVAAGSVTAVPEPSTFAALAGLCALGAVAIRRRRA